MKLVMEPNNALDTMSMADYKVARSLGANETRFGLSDEDGPMLLTDE